MNVINPVALAIFLISLGGASASTYIGCYVDASSRDLHARSWKNNLMTVEKCIKFCSDHKYQYAGLQHYDECWCGTDYGDHGRAKEGDCLTPCHGNKRQMCGGTWRNSVYSTSNYVGCYIDSGNQDLNGRGMKDQPKMTVEFCLKLCRDHGFAYAGLQYYDECFCGVDYGRYGKGAEKDCNAPCKANKHQMCGGTNRNSVYSTAMADALPDPNWFALSNGHQYLLVRSHNTWQQSKAICATHGAALASEGLRNSRIREEIKTIIKCGESIWIGLNDLAVEGRWEWSDGVTSKRSNTQWGSNEPNNLRGDEHCGEMVSSWNFHINDQECTDRRYALCEKQI